MSSGTDGTCDRCGSTKHLTEFCDLYDVPGLGALVAEKEAGRQARDCERRIRDRFQIKHPTFTPPPWAGRLVWERWLEANLKKHGVKGFYEQGLERIAEPIKDLLPRGDWS